MSWQQLISIREQARLDAREDRDRRRVACPNDGEPLKQGPNGQLFCPCGDWSEEQDQT